MNDNVEIIRSNKGGMKIIHRGYMYTVHKKRQSGGIRWRCTQRSLHCKGSISTGNGPPRVNMPHNHIPDPHSVALARCRQLEEFADITSLLETECEEMKDSLPLQQRIAAQNAPQIQIPHLSEPLLQSQPLSPTKLKVTRQHVKAQVQTQVPQKVAQDETIDEMCLRWNSHHSNMQTSFPQLLDEEKYVDVTLATEGKMLKCHRMILSSCSTYFEEVLSSILPFQHPVIFLKGIPFWVLKSLTDFMYAGEVNIDQNNLQELLDAAELLKIKGLAGKSNTPPSPPPPAAKPTEKPHHSLKKEQKTKYGKHTGLSSYSTPPSANLRHNTPKVTPVETVPVLTDPLELLEQADSYHEHTPEPSTSSKVKESKAPAKKIFQRKMKKRKLVEAEPAAAPFPFHLRKGTRSRPNIKIPKYYHNDYDEAAKRTASEEEEVFQIETIKDEPIDVEENDITIDDSFLELTMDHDEDAIVSNFDSNNSVINPFTLGSVRLEAPSLEETEPVKECNNYDPGDAIGRIRIQTVRSLVSDEMVKTRPKKKKESVIDSPDVNAHNFEKSAKLQEGGPLDPDLNPDKVRIVTVSISDSVNEDVEKLFNDNSSKVIAGDKEVSIDLTGEEDPLLAKSSATAEKSIEEHASDLINPIRQNILVNELEKGEEVLEVEDKNEVRSVDTAEDVEKQIDVVMCLDEPEALERPSVSEENEEIMTDIAAPIQNEDVMNVECTNEEKPDHSVAYVETDDLTTVDLSEKREDPLSVKPVDFIATSLENEEVIPKVLESPVDSSEYVMDFTEVLVQPTEPSEKEKVVNMDETEVGGDPHYHGAESVENEDVNIALNKVVGKSVDRSGMSVDREEDTGNNLTEELL